MLEPRYDHQAIEERIYKLWERSGYFNPDNLPARINADKNAADKRRYKIRVNLRRNLRESAFSIIMPPPNANGSLHLGHAVFVALQDIMVRFSRMRGKKTLWLPGADHAGFETQVVFDKKLEKEGRNRFEIDRETLWKEIWEFTQKNKKIMENQLRKLGASCDWSREKFTLDPDIIKIVYGTFEKLYKDGLVYRDLRVVNWCPKNKTALSDLEVKYAERKDPLYYIKYGPLTLATVRPETKFGDTALAVNPKDKRYQTYIGKEIEAKGVLGPLKFKVIADEAVDPGFGTGVIKVTPAHDMTDFEIWQRHKNEIPGPKIIIDENGRLTGETGEFKGLKVAEARQKTAEKMKGIGILEKIEPDYVHQVATCYKCGATLEPIPKMQWFVKTKPLAEKAIKTVEQKKIKFCPDHTKKVYFHWLKNIRDWNISRQIVWGIRIPAWYCIQSTTCKPKINPEIKSRWFVVRHGETDWNKEGRTQGHSDIPLNETGRQQARDAAETLKHKYIDLIISSDLGRCRATAEIIREATGAEIILDKNLRERHLGVTQGMLGNERDALYRDVLYSYEGKPPGGESFKELEERVWGTFTHHKKSHRHKNIVLVTHGGPVRMLLKKMKKWNFDKALQHKTKNAEILEFTVSDPCPVCGGDLYEQDPDVFDTWFSSGQWPFATLMTTRPQQKDFKEFYSTDVLETGYDILFFWVARMVMLGLYRTGKIPFKNVYLHGMVRDKDRQKMSKSKGNVIDPLGVAELYGADALRMALVAGNTAGRDIAISEEKIRGYRNFATKIWNIARFILLNKPERNGANMERETARKPNAADRKHIRDVLKIKTKVAGHIEKFEFHLAAETAYHYIWHTFADKIIEEYKEKLKSEPMFFEEALGGAAGSVSGEARAAAPRTQAGASRRNERTAGSEKNIGERLAAYQTLETILLECLKMLHPFMPFVTEEIFRKFRPGELLMVEQW